MGSSLSSSSSLSSVVDMRCWIRVSGEWGRKMEEGMVLVMVLVWLWAILMSSLGVDFILSRDELGCFLLLSS